MNKIEKDKIISALKIAHENTIKEQDKHHERIEAMKLIGNEEYVSKLSLMGWDGLDKELKDVKYPPSSQERENYLEQKWDEIPRRIEIDKIDDKDIAFHTYMLGEVADHCERIKSMVRFYEVLNAHPDDRYATFLYRLWTYSSMLSQLIDEQDKLDKTEHIDSLMQCVDAATKVFDIFADNPEEMYEMFNEASQNQ